MPRYNVEYNNSTTIRREFPDELGDIKSVDLAIYDTGGTALLASTAATLGGIGASPSYAFSGTLTVAAVAGDTSVTVNASCPTLYAGDLIRIGGSTTAQDTVKVESYNSSTRVIYLTDYLRHDHAVGEFIKPRFCTYALNTTTVATWTSQLEFTIEWTFYAAGDGSTTPYMPYTDTGRVLKRVSGEGGLEAAFKMRYRQYAGLVDDVDFESLSTDALDELRDLFNSKGMDIDKAVDSHAFYELRLAQMAYSMAFGQGQDWEGERAAITSRRLELINLVQSLPIWVDADQDLSEEDEEVQTYERPYPRRRIF